VRRRPGGKGRARKAGVGARGVDEGRTGAEGEREIRARVVKLRRRGLRRVHRG